MIMPERNRVRGFVLVGDVDLDDRTVGERAAANVLHAGTAKLAAVYRLAEKEGLAVVFSGALCRRKFSLPVVSDLLPALRTATGLYCASEKEQNEDQVSTRSSVGLMGLAGCLDVAPGPARIDLFQVEPEGESATCVALVIARDSLGSLDELPESMRLCLGEAQVMLCVGAKAEAFSAQARAAGFSGQIVLAAPEVSQDVAVVEDEHQSLPRLIRRYEGDEAPAVFLWSPSGMRRHAIGPEAFEKAYGTAVATVEGEGSQAESVFAAMVARSVKQAEGNHRCAGVIGVLGEICQERKVSAEVWDDIDALHGDIVG